MCIRDRCGAAGFGDFFYARFAAFGVATGDCDFGARFGHRLGASTAKGSSGADDYGNFIVQIE